MKRLLFLIVPLALAACNKTAGEQADDAMTQVVRKSWNAYAQSVQMDTIAEIVPSKQSDRLYEVQYDEGTFLLLVDRTHSKVTDILEKALSSSNPSFFNVTGSSELMFDTTDSYTVNGDTLTIQTYSIYTVDNPQGTDTLLFKLDEESYLTNQGRFDKKSHFSTVLKDNGQLDETLRLDLWNRIARYDLSTSVINPDSIFESPEEKNEGFLRPDPLGYRGDGFHKFDIHFTEIIKSNDYEYQISGLTRCQGKILPMRGLLALDSIQVCNQEIEAVIGANQDIVPAKLHAHYRFDVYENNIAIALLYGKSEYDILEYNSTLYYDALFLVADGYCNNQYEGVWVNLVDNDSLVCNWGDFRIPNSKDLDVGCGAFHVNDKWKQNGWSLFSKNAYELDPSQEYIEDCLWWQQSK